MKSKCKKNTYNLVSTTLEKWHELIFFPLSLPLKVSLFLYVWVLCLYVCLNTICVGQKRVSHPLRVELETAVSHHMGSGTQTRDPWKSSHCS